jgi:hypothetical protein
MKFMPGYMKSIIAISLLIILLYLAAWGISPVFTFIRWDNFEHLTSFIINAQNQLFAGHLPLWSHYTCMGQPLLGNGQTGAFYPPIILLFGLLKIFHMTPDLIPFLLAVFHSAIMAGGIFMFCKTAGCNTLMSASAAVTCVGIGYFQICFQVWTIFSAHFAWIPWAFLSLYRVVLSRSRTWMLVYTMVMVLWLSLAHGQFILYDLFFLAIFAVALFFKFKAGWPALQRVLFLTIPSFLIAAPALLPVYETMQLSARALPLSKTEFLDLGIPPFTLLGSVFPLYKAPYNVFTDGFSYVTFSGVWPVILMASCIVLMLITGKKHIITNFKNLQKFTSPLFVPILIVAGVALVLSFGAYGGLYGLTYGIPIWTSMRWPHKLFPYSVIWWPVLAVLLIPLWEKCTLRLRLISISSALITIVVSVILVVFYHGLSSFEPGIWLWCITCGTILSISSLLCIQKSISKWFFFAGTIMITVGSISLGQAIDLRRYPEKIGITHNWQSKLNGMYRFFPLSMYSMHEGHPDGMQEYGLFESASLNRLMSATGINHAMLSKIYLDAMPIDFWGLLPEPERIQYVNSPMADLCAVRYLIVNKLDTAMRVHILQNNNIIPLFETPHSTVFERKSARPIVSFADSVCRYTEKSFHTYLQQSSTRDIIAFVSDSTLIEKRLFSGEMKEVQLIPNGISFKVQVPASGGYALISQTYTPQWKAWINGVSVHVIKTNKFIQGVELPPGSVTVEMRFVSDVMKMSWTCIIAGIMLLLLYMYLFRKSV